MSGCQPRCATGRPQSHLWHLLLLLGSFPLALTPPATAFFLQRNADTSTPGQIQRAAERQWYRDLSPLEISRNDLRWGNSIGGRRLHEWPTEDDDEDTGDGSGTVVPLPPSSLPSTVAPPFETSPPPHHRRHQKSLGEVHRVTRVHSTAPALFAFGASLSPALQPSSVLPVGPSSLPSSSPPPPPPPPTSSSSSPSTGRRRVRAHEACYSSNEVLLVIGVTCAVNFAFILLVVSLVHLCNRGASKAVPPSPEFEYVIPHEDGLLRRGVADAVAVGAASAAGAYVRVQEYVDSLPDPSRRPGTNLHGTCSMEDLLFLD